MANKLSKKKTTIQKVVKKQKPVVMAQTKASRVLTNFTIPTGEFVTAVGRRKTATARVRVYRHAGDFVVNDKVVGEYFDGVANGSVRYNRPLMITNTLGDHAITVKVNGSGIAAQLEAVVLGISRCLIKLNPDLRPLLKKEGLLSRDDRMKETRKIGTGGKARRTKQSPKR